jgi:AraC family transcriptional activator of pobA
VLKYETIRQYSETFNNPCLHPLISLVDLNKSGMLKRSRFMMGFYAVILKETRCGDMRYGNNYYDYADGTLVFFAPGQVITHEPEGEWHQPYGKALVFHADMIKGTTLGKQINEYSFFNYKSNEALHLSEKEKATVSTCLANIESEIRQNIDKHSKKLIVANLELLLKYCSRFYDRQFITRENVNHGILEQFEEILNEFFRNEKHKTDGLPSVSYFADQLHLSPNYFGDLIKKETGKSALDFIHLKLLETAKDRILDTTKSISEIAYELGFKYPQHFSRLFKQKVGVSPLEYRGSN